MSENNYKGLDLDATCVHCGHVFREHADGPCLWPCMGPEGVGLVMCGCLNFTPAPEDSPHV